MTCTSVVFFDVDLGVKYHGLMPPVTWHGLHADPLDMAPACHEPGLICLCHSFSEAFGVKLCVKSHVLSLPLTCREFALVRRRVFSMALQAFIVSYNEDMTRFKRVLRRCYDENTTRFKRALRRYYDGNTARFKRVLRREYDMKKHT